MVRRTVHGKIQGLYEDGCKRFKWVIFEIQFNHGICFILNTLLSQIKGEYIFFHSSDDIVKSHTLTFDYVLVVGDYEFINTDGERIG